MKKNLKSVMGNLKLKSRIPKPIMKEVVEPVVESSADKEIEQIEIYLKPVAEAKMITINFQFDENKVNPDESIETDDAVSGVISGMDEARGKDYHSVSTCYTEDGKLIGISSVDIQRGPIHQKDPVQRQVTNEKDTMLKIRGRKDYAYLFNPLNFPEIIGFLEVLKRCFPKEELTKVPPLVIQQLKVIAWYKEKVGIERKFIPKDSEKIKILMLAYIEYVSEQSGRDVFSIFETLKASTHRMDIKNKYKELESIYIKFGIYNIKDWMNFDHYDMVIKYHRSLQVPTIEFALNQILEEIDNSNEFRKLMSNAKMDKKDTKDTYTKTMIFLNLVGKMGIRYCSSRSNLEWYLYNGSLKRIRNFFSKNKYSLFAKIVLDKFEADTQNDKFNNGLYIFEKEYIPKKDKIRSKFKYVKNTKN